MEDSEYFKEFDNMLNIMDAVNCNVHIPFWSNCFEEFKMLLNNMDLFVSTVQLMYQRNPIWENEDTSLYFQDFESAYKEPSEENH